MKKEELQLLTQEAAKNIKTEEDLGAALNTGFNAHLGFSKHEQSKNDNSRNGYTRKTLQIEVDTPRDRHEEFAPKLVKKTSTPFHLYEWQDSLSVYDSGSL